MEKYTGKSIFKGIAIGKILFYQKGEQPVKRVKIEDTAEQIKRYEDARAKAAEQLQGLYEKALKEVGEANAAVFEVHQMMLEDDDYIDSVVKEIQEAFPGIKGFNRRGLYRMKKFYETYCDDEFVLEYASSTSHTTVIRQSIL